MKRMWFWARKTAAVLLILAITYLILHFAGLWNSKERAVDFCLFIGALGTAAYGLWVGSPWWGGVGLLAFAAIIPLGYFADSSGPTPGSGDIIFFVLLPGIAGAWIIAKFKKKTLQGDGDPEATSDAEKPITTKVQSFVLAFVEKLKAVSRKVPPIPPGMSNRLQSGGISRGSYLAVSMWAAALIYAIVDSGAFTSPISFDFSGFFAFLVVPAAILVALDWLLGRKAQST